MLKRFKQLRPSLILSLLILILVSIGALTSSCGKRKPPLPPRERVQQSVKISGIQLGEFVELSWKMPARNAPDGSVLNIDRVDVYRLAEPLSSTLNLTQEEFASRSTLIGSKKVNDDDFSFAVFTYRDQLKFAGQAARLIYAVRLVNASGQKASFSNFLLVEPTARVAKNPTSLNALLTEPAVVLSWNKPTANIDNSTPINVLGYNVYRIDKETDTTKILNDSPVDAESYLDETFSFGKTFEYFVRAVSIGVEGESVESVSSNTISITPIDDFPPTPPSAITIAAAPNNLSIFFATNPEKDIDGYSLYRSTEKALQLDKWEKLTPDLLKTNTFQDKNVLSGKTYYYYLTATDQAGNTSAPSQIFSETAP